MAAWTAKRTAILAGLALSLVATPALARGGGGGHGGGGGGHGGGGGGHFGGGGGHYGGGGGHYSSGGHFAGGGHYGGRAPTYHAYGGFHGYGGRGYGYRGGVFMGGGRVPAFVGGRRGGVWWGPRYGWRVPAYWAGYYRPYPAYLGVGYWVTDWLMLDYLAAEEAREEATGGAYVMPMDSPPIDNDVREELRGEVDQDLASPGPAYDTAPPSGNTLVVSDPRIARALGSPRHVFVVSIPVTVTNQSGGGTCSLTPADVLRTYRPVPSGQSMTDVLVAGAKKSSCAPGSTVTLPIADLVQFEQDLLSNVSKGSAAANAAAAQSAEPAAEQQAPPPGATAPAWTPPPPPAPAEGAPTGSDTPAPQDMSTTPTVVAPSGGEMSL